RHARRARRPARPRPARAAAAVLPDVRGLRAVSRPGRGGAARVAVGLELPPRGPRARARDRSRRGARARGAAGARAARGRALAPARGVAARPVRAAAVGPAARPRGAGMTFDPCGPLPTGVTVLEASAGTGKTYTIAALAARYVAEGTPLERILLVTFTRMATGELRERVRERLVAVEQGLARALAGAQPDDAVVRLLAEGAPEDVEQRRWRLARALAGFDAATIATTHGFCQEVLGGLGVAGDVERDT